jgi:hypothetical protein
MKIVLVYVDTSKEVVELTGRYKGLDAQTSAEGYRRESAGFPLL